MTCAEFEKTAKALEAAAKTVKTQRTELTGLINKRDELAETMNDWVTGSIRNSVFGSGC